MAHGTALLLKAAEVELEALANMAPGVLPVMQLPQVVVGHTIPEICQFMLRGIFQIPTLKADH
jgi:hypothetical protein